MSVEAVEYKVGDYVEIAKNRKGIIRFQGNVGGFGTCFGIELDSPIDGGNNGTFDGEEFFDCDDGKGTFVKGIKIIKKMDDPPPQTAQKTQDTTTPTEQSTENKETSNNTNNPKDKKKKETKSKTSHKPKKGTNKKQKDKKKGTKPLKNGSTKKDKDKDTKKGSSHSRQKTKDKNKAKHAKTKSKRQLKTKKTPKKNGLEDFNVPTDIENIDKLKLIYPQLSNTKLPFKKRAEIMKICAEIMDDKKCDADTAQYATDGFKKIFTEQMKDKKLIVHKQLYHIIEIMMRKHSKLYKNKNTYFLKCLMIHIGKLKVNDKKGLEAIENTIKSMIKHIGLKDKKQMVVILNEFIRNGTTSKNRTVKNKSWNFIYIALDTKARSDGKISKNALDSMEKGLKQGLSNSDRFIQEGAFKILDFLSQNELDERVEKLFGRMSATAQKLYNKKYPSSTPHWFTESKTSKNEKKRSSKNKIGHRGKKLSVGQYAFDQKALAFINKRDSLERLDAVDIGNGKVKRNGRKRQQRGKGKKDKSMKKKDKTKGKEGKDSKRVNSGLRDKYNKIKHNKNKSKDKKNKTKEKEKKGKRIKGKEKGKHKDKEKNKDEETNASLKKNSHQRSDRNVLEPDSFGDLGDLLGGLGTGDGVDIGGDILEALDVPILPEGDDDDDGDGVGEEEDIEIDQVQEDIGQGQKDEDGKTETFPQFPVSFLEMEIRIDWKMLEYLCEGNKTNQLMSILSRSKDPNFDLLKHKLSIIDYSASVPNTFPLSSDDDVEITATQLSYNLMRLLSVDGDDHSNEVLSSYLLRKCNEILIHSLAVYHHDVSQGNVYHGRVVLEILLNSWPKSLMTALTKDTINDAIIYQNTQMLFKNALFRNLHQGNLNSFFLDLICLKPPNPEKYQQILAHKRKIINLFKKWRFMHYLLETSSSYSVGIDGDDDVATKYATFFIDLVARSAAIPEVAPLFEDCEHLIIDSFINGLLDKEKKRSTWHRMFCGQILIQFMDICSRPTIMDPTQLLAAESGLIEPEPSPNILYPLFGKCLKRLHSFIPKLSQLVIDYESDFKEIKLNYDTIVKPFGQIRLHCLELLTISADFAQFECGNVLGKIPMHFWNYLLEMAFIHKNNNIFLCHFRRLIHLTMIFRRRILKHLFTEKKFLDRFITFYVSEKQPSALHGYILQMVYDIWQHDQDIDSDDEGTQHEEDDDDDDDTDSMKHVVSQYL